MGTPIIDPLSDELPLPLVQRTAKAPPNQLATFRFPADRLAHDASRWFSSEPQTHPVRSDNEVKYLIDGKTTFAEMARVIRTTTDPSSHFIYVLGWTMFLDFAFAEDGTTLGQLFQAASDRGIQIRVMLWAAIRIPFKMPQFGQNQGVVGRVTRLASGQGIFDHRVLPLGAHHQKVMIVAGSEGLTAFCGGIDVNPDRVFPNGVNGAEQEGGPMHDVHCRIRGPAAFDCLQTFIERWTDYIRAMPVKEKKPLLGKNVSLDAQAKSGRLHVQIARTFGNATRHGMSAESDAQSPPLIQLSPYEFAKNGERTIRAMFLRAIAAARRFIYIEDQYLVNPETSAALAKALPNLSHLTILIPHSDISDMPRVHELRKRFINPLRAAGGRKVRVFTRFPFQPNDQHSYVHAKTWVFDDQFAIIGSANNNLRGWTHDSEFGVGVYDESSNAKAAYTFAHRLRISLWAEHLNMNTSDGHADLADGVASTFHWLQGGTNVAVFDENLGVDFGPSTKTPLVAVDPDGT